MRVFTSGISADCYPLTYCFHMFCYSWLEWTTPNHVPLSPLSVFNLFNASPNSQLQLTLSPIIWTSMDETNPHSQASTSLTCTHCGKTGHKETTCWIKNPEQWKVFIEKKYGKDKKKEKKQSFNGDIDERTATTQVMIGPSRTRAPKAPSKFDSQGIPPHTGSKSKQSGNAPKNKSTVPRQSKPELSYFVPKEKSSYVQDAKDPMTLTQLL